MNLLVKTLFGSHVYGTNVPTSDRDYKAIYLPSSEDILLQRVKSSIQQNTKLNPNSKNGAEDIDVEILSLQKYLSLLLEGQTVAMDILFTPSQHYVEPVGKWWTFLQANKHSLISKKCQGFVGYCRTQANKYGIKGSRVNAMKLALDLLKPHGPKVKLGDALSKQGTLPENEFLSIVMINGPRGVPEPHLQVCGRKIPFHATVQYATEVFQKIYDEYGARAQLAARNEGVDWKALMHAVRISNEAQELLSTGHITFPRPEAPLLIKIRKGELSYAEVAEKIEEGLVGVEAASAASELPDEPNAYMADYIVHRAYEEVVKHDW